MLESRISAGAIGKLPTTWKNILENSLSDIVNWQSKKTEQLYKVSSFCLDHHPFKQEELESVGELADVCSQMVLKCLYLARIGKLDILWSVNKLARSVTKWTQACDRRLARLISEENESVGELSTVCSQIVLKCLHLARIGRISDILWSVKCASFYKMDKIL